MPKRPGLLVFVLFGMVVCLMQSARADDAVMAARASVIAPILQRLRALGASDTQLTTEFERYRVTDPMIIAAALAEAETAAAQRHDYDLGLGDDIGGADGLRGNRWSDQLAQRRMQHFAATPDV